VGGVQHSQKALSKTNNNSNSNNNNGNFLLLLLPLQPPMQPQPNVVCATRNETIFWWTKPGGMRRKAGESSGREVGQGREATESEAAAG